MTRKDVARYAGVSTAVVSYVVNGGPKRVAPATEAKVQDAIRVLGYRPNAAARALKLGSSETIGLVIPDNSNPFFSLLAHAVEDAAAELGYALVLTNSDGNLAKERRNIRNLAARQVDGVVLSSVLFEPDLADLESAEIPAVLLNHSAEAAGVQQRGRGPGGRRTDRRGAPDRPRPHATSRLAMGTNTGQLLDGREEGWLQALAGRRPAGGPDCAQPFTREGGYAAGKRLLAGAERPTAIFASSDMQAVGILRALARGGPVRAGGYGVGVLRWFGGSGVQLAAADHGRQPAKAMAEAAVNALIGAGRGNTPEHLIFPADLQVRQSCGCCRE